MATDSVAERGTFAVVGGSGAILARNPPMVARHAIRSGRRYGGGE
jgi:hypothetical protein